MRVIEFLENLFRPVRVARAISSLAFVLALSACGDKPGRWQGLSSDKLALFGAEEVAAAVTTSSLPAASLVFTQQPKAVAAGAAMDASTAPKLELRDAKGARVVGGVDASLTVTASVLTGTNDMSGTATVQVVGGVVDFSASSLKFFAAANRTLRFTVTNSAGKVLTATSGSFAVSAGPASQLVFTTAMPATVTSGIPWTTLPALEIRDAYGNRVSTGADASASVALALSAGNGTLVGTTTGLKASAGRITLRSGSIKMAELGSGKALTFTATTSQGALTATTSSFEVKHGPGSKLVFTRQATASNSVDPFSQMPKVEIQDQFGNLVTTGTDSTAAISLKIVQGTGSLSGGSVSSGLLTMNAVGGVADFTGSAIFVNQAGTNKKLMASGKINNRQIFAASQAFTIAVGPASATTSTITVNPATGAKADGKSTVLLTITLKDQYGNVISGYAGSNLTVAASGTGNTLTQPTGVSDSSGRLTARLVTTIPGAQSVSLTAPASLASVAPASVTFLAGALIANNATYSTTEDTPVSGTLVTNDVTPYVRTFSVVTQGVKGTVAFTNANTGAFTYTPNLNANGTDTFTYKVNDTRTNSNTATVTVNISAVNDVPVGVAQTIQATADTVYNGTVSAVDPEGTPLTYAIASGSNQGTVSITNASTGAFRYTPNAATIGNDSFTFTASDGLLTSVPTTVTVIINQRTPDAPTNLAGTALNANLVSLTWTDTSWNEDFFLVERATGAASTTFTQIAQLAANSTSYNDTTAANGTTYRYRVKSSNSKGVGTSSIINVTTPASPSVPANFTATLSSSTVLLQWDASSGTSPITYTVERSSTGAAGTYSTLASGLTIRQYIDSAVNVGDTYHYRVFGVNPGGNGSPAGPVAVTVVAPPFLAFVESPIGFIQGVTATFIPTSAGGVVTSCFVSPALPSGISLSSDCQISGSSSTIKYPATNYTLTAGNAGGVQSLVVALGVFQAAPVFSYPVTTASWNQGVAITSITPSALTRVATVSVSPALPAGVSVNSTTGVISGTPTGYIGSTAFTFTGTNTTGLSATATITAVINAAPTATAGSFTTAEDTPYNGSLTGTDPDGPSATYSVVSQPSAGTGTVAITDASTGAFTYTPAADYFGTTSFTFRRSDGTLNSNTATITVTVTAVNDAPTLGAITNPAAINEDSGVQTVSLSGIGRGASNETDTLSVTATSSNTGLIPNPSVTYTSANATGSLSYTPVANANGSATVTVTVSDGSLTAVRTFTVQVNNVNDAPTIGTITNPAAINEESGAQTVAFSGVTTGNANEADTLTVTATSSNTNVIPNPTVIYTSANTGGTLMYTPVADAFGSATITVQVSDGSATASTTFTVQVNNVNDAPTLAAISDPAAINEDATAQTVSFSGVGRGGAFETETLTVTATSSNTGLIPNPTVSYTSPSATGSVSYTPVANASGSAVVTVTVSDGSLTASRTFNVVVNPGNDAPTLSSISTLPAVPSVAYEDTDYTITYAALLAAANEADIDSATINFQVGTVSTGTLTQGGMAVTANTTILSATSDPLVWRAAADANGTLNAFTVRAHDGSLTSASAMTVVVSVTAVNDAPTLAAISNPAAIQVGAGNQTVTLTGIGRGAANETDTLSVSVTSSNATLIPTPSVSYTSPNASATLTYAPNGQNVGTSVITATVSDGAASTSQTFTVTVNAALPTLSYTGASGTTGNVAVAMSITPTSLVTNGAALSACAVKAATTALPAWASVNASTCVISGTPTATLSATTYTIVATNSAGTSANALVTLTVNASAPTLSYAAATGTNGVAGMAMTVSPTTLNANGASVTGCVIKGGTTALPSGLSVNATTCVISGTPAAPALSTTYTLVATNSAGNSADATVLLNITGGVPTLSYSGAGGTTGAVGASMTVNPTTLINNGSAITNCAIMGATALPSGVTLSPTTCVISGTPTAVMSATAYTIIATNAGGNSANAPVTLQVNANTPVISYTSATGTVGTFNSAMSVSPTSVNNRGAAITACGIKSGTTALPAGLTVNATTCVISGTPTWAAASAVYTLVATNSAGTSADATVTLQVNALAPVLSYSGGTKTYTAGTNMTTTATLTLNGANLSACGVKSGTTALPSGLTVDPSTCAISGITRATAAAANYTIVATNSGGTSANAVVSIQVNAGVPSLGYLSTTLNVGTASTITPSTYFNNGSNITACAVKASTTALPAWATINATTCNITGTPTATQAATNYTIVATNSVGNSLDTLVTITVNPGVPVLSYSGATGTTGTVGTAMTVTPPTLTTNGASITGCAIKAATTALPAGLTVAPTTCVISGTPTTVSAATNYTLVATNSAGSSANAVVSLTINAGIPTLSYSGGTNSFTVGTNMLLNATYATNGANLTGCAVKSGTPALPTGLSVNTVTCAISGTTQSVQAASSYTIVATNSVGSSTPAVVSISSVAGVPTLTYAGATGTTGTVGSAMSVSPTTIAANGASITACAIKATTTALPAGLSVNSTTCVITGTPTTVSAATNYTLVATNSAGSSANAVVSLTINAGVPVLSYSGSAGRTGTVGSAMSVTPSTLTANGAAISGCAIKASTTALPAGLAVNASTCVISGTPSVVAAATNYTLVATNSAGSSADAVVNLTVNAGVPILSFSGATGTTGSYGSAMSIGPTTLNNQGASVTACAIKASTTALPTGLSVNATTCVISGTPSVAAAAANYTVVATNSAGTSADAVVSITVNALVPTLSYSGALGTSGTVGTAMSVSPTSIASNGANITACAIKASTPALPAGLAVNATTCVISGTPTAVAAAANYTVVATNSAGTSANAVVNLTVGAGAPILSYSGATGTTGTYGVAMSVSPTTLTTNGGAITACAVKSGTTALPSGLSVNSSTCVISGTPSAAGSGTYTITATNSGGTGDGVVSLVVNAGVPILSFSGATGTTGSYGSAMSISPTTLNNQGASVTGCAIKASTTALPTGLSVNATTCVISGTPSVAAAATNYTLVATNSAGASADAIVSLTVNALVPTLAYTGATGTSGKVGTAMSVSPTTLAANGASITACAIKASTPALPAGLGVNATTCVISGTPTAVAAAANYTVVATNSAGASANAVVNLTVGAGAPILSYSGATGTTGTYGVAMSVSPTTLTTNGGAITACAVKSGTTALPLGLSVNSSTCVISGTPSAAGSGTYTITATNSGGTGDGVVSLVVNATVPTLSYNGAGGTTGSIHMGMSVSPTVLSGNGASITGCAIKSGTTALPTGLSVNPTSCVISGVPAVAVSGTTYTIVASSAVGSSANALVTLAVVNSAPYLASGSFYTDEDTSFSDTITGIDPEGMGVTYSIAAWPSSGAGLSWDAASGGFSYYPASNWSGEDTFQVTLTDADGLSSDPIVVAVYVNGVNDAPTASNIVFNVPVSGSLGQRSLASVVTDIEGDSISNFQVSGSPSYGSLSYMWGDGTFDYQAPWWATQDSFTFTAYDSGGAVSNAGTVTLNIYEPLSPSISYGNWVYLYAGETYYTGGGGGVGVHHYQDTSGLGSFSGDGVGSTFTIPCGSSSWNWNRIQVTDDIGSSVDLYYYLNGDSSSCSGSSTDVYGCTDSGASNYNPSANMSDGSCQYCGAGWWDGSSCQYPSGGTVYGCTDTSAVNFNSSANSDDGSCYYFTLVHSSNTYGSLDPIYLDAQNGSGDYTFSYISGSASLLQGSALILDCGTASGSVTVSVYDNITGRTATATIQGSGLENTACTYMSGIGSGGVPSQLCAGNDGVSFGQNCAIPFPFYPFADRGVYTSGTGPGVWVSSLEAKCAAFGLAPGSDGKCYPLEELQCREGGGVYGDYWSEAEQSWRRGCFGNDRELAAAWDDVCQRWWGYPMGNGMGWCGNSDDQGYCERDGGYWDGSNCTNDGSGLRQANFSYWCALQGNSMLDGECVSQVEYGCRTSGGVWDGSGSCLDFGTACSSAGGVLRGNFCTTPK